MKGLILGALALSSAVFAIDVNREEDYFTVEPGDELPIELDINNGLFKCKENIMVIFTDFMKMRVCPKKGLLVYKDDSWHEVQDYFMHDSVAAGLGYTFSYSFGRDEEDKIEAGIAWAKSSEEVPLRVSTHSLD